MNTDIGGKRHLLTFPLDGELSIAVDWLQRVINDQIHFHYILRANSRLQLWSESIPIGQGGTRIEVVWAEVVHFDEEPWPPELGERGVAFRFDVIRSPGGGVQVRCYWSTGLMFRDFLFGLLEEVARGSPRACSAIARYSKKVGWDSLEDAPVLEDCKPTETSTPEAETGTGPASPDEAESNSRGTEPIRTSQQGLRPRCWNFMKRLRKAMVEILDRDEHATLGQERMAEAMGLSYDYVRQLSSDHKKCCGFDWKRDVEDRGLLQDEHLGR